MTIMRSVSAAVVAVLTTLALVLVMVFVPANANATEGGPGGNNGTIKIHEYETPEGTENNDPKVCKFNVEGFGFDSGQELALRGEVQGGDGPTGEAFTIPNVTADSEGGFASEYVQPKDGHYKVTAYGKDANGDYTDEKAKSKVFKVECPPTPPTEEPPVVVPPVVVPPVVNPPVTTPVPPVVTTPNPPKKRIKPSVAIRANCAGDVAYVANNKKSNVPVAFKYLNDGKVKKFVVKAGKKKVVTEKADNRSVVWIKTKGDSARTVVPGACFVPHAGFRK